MVIKASSVQQVAALIADLSSERAVTREAAIARLIVFGSRVIDRVNAVVESDAAPDVRAAALRVLEAIADTRALDTVLAAVDSHDVPVAAAAVSAARPFLRGAGGAKVVDRLASLVLATKRDETLRLAALRALRELGQATVAPLIDALRADPTASIRAAADGPAIEDPAVELERASALGLADDPDPLSEALLKAGAAAPLPVLVRIIERIREREGREPPSRRAHWACVRGRAHVALADRNSRLALYDLRESFDAATAPLPVEFVAALLKVGDRSCLEALAAAYVQPGSPVGHGDSGHDWWHLRLKDAFRAIVSREKLTRRHGVMKRIEKRWPRAVGELLA